MKTLLSKLWNLSPRTLYWLFAISIFWSTVVMQTKTANTMSYFSDYSVGAAETIGLILGLLLSAMVLALILRIIVKLSYKLFARIYTRSFASIGSDSMFTTDMPMTLSQYVSLILMFIIMNNVLIGLVRLIYLVTPQPYLFIENCIKPIINAAFALLCFFTAKKYLLFDRIAFNAYLAGMIPFAVYMLVLL